MVRSIDRFGRSVLHLANVLTELDAAGALYSDQQSDRQHHANGTSHEPDGGVLPRREGAGGAVGTLEQRCRLCLRWSGK
jgi:hypothetical protein